MSLFMTAVPLATVVGGPLSGALLGLHGLGGVEGWRWLFVIEGVPAVLLGARRARLPHRPAEGRGLARRRRSADALEERLEAEARGDAGARAMPGSARR